MISVTPVGRDPIALHISDTTGLCAGSEEADDATE